MLAHERRNKIGTIIKNEGSVTVEIVTQSFGVSMMTAWRDLRELEKSGAVYRVHGGAVSAVSAPVISEQPFAGKQSVRTREKEAIARYVASELIGSNDIIIVEGGTTAAAVVPHLEAANITLLTNGLNVLNRAAERLPYITVMSCGGMLRERSLTFVGPQAESFFANHRADKLVISAAAFSIPDGLMDPRPLEIQIKQAMARCARQRIAVVDSSKFELRSLAIALSTDEIDILVTDDGVSAETLQQLRRSDIDVRIANNADS
jgi:DeoR/GlpR family transcriptional regulator of sugar metabolism